MTQDAFFSLLGPRLSAGRTLAATCLLAALARGQVAHEDLTVPGLDGQPHLGDRILVDGDTALVGLTVFERDGDGHWVATAEIEPPPGQTSIHEPFYYAFGNSAALVGDQLLFGVNHRHSLEPGLNGHVLVYERQEDATWVHTQTIETPPTSMTEEVRTTVAASGDSAVIGALTVGDYNYGGSKVEAFERLPDGTWQELQNLGSGGYAEWVGSTVAMRDDWMAYEDSYEAWSSDQFLHVRSRAPGGSWQGEGVIDPPGGVGPMSVHAGRVLVGSTNSAYLYESQGGGVWTEQQLTVEAPTGGFGSTVHLEGDLALIGTSAFATPAYGYLFERGPDGVWREELRFQHTDGSVGNLAWIDGDIAMSRPFSLLASGSLYHGAPSLSLASPGVQDLLLRAGSERAGDLFFLLGSASGTAPGLPLGGFSLPLVADGYTQLLVNTAGAGVLAPFLGQLDDGGRADATFTLPAGLPASLAGAKLHHAFFTFDEQAAVTSVSNAVEVELVQ